jgi:hypothetical protein
MASYKLTGKLIKERRGSTPKSQLAMMLGVQYRGLIDKLEDGSRRCPQDLEIKLLKFLSIDPEEYIEALKQDYENELRRELSVEDKNVIETEVVEEDKWKNLI